MIESIASVGSISHALVNVTNNTSTSIVAAKTGYCIYVLSWAASNAHATQGTKIVLETSGGTDLSWGYVAPVGGRVERSYQTYMKVPVSTALHVKAITTGADVDFEVEYFYGPEF